MNWCKNKSYFKNAPASKPLWVKRALTQLANDVIVICILLLDTSFRQKCLRTFESWLLCIGRLISKTDNIMHFACLVKPAGVDLVSWLTYLFGGHTSTCQVSSERFLNQWLSGWVSLKVRMMFGVKIFDANIDINFVLFVKKIEWKFNGLSGFIAYPKSHSTKTFTEKQ